MKVIKILETHSLYSINSIWQYVKYLDNTRGYYSAITNQSKITGCVVVKKHLIFKLYVI